ncbi:hypothetical protein DERF_014481 [Dermatophagoides farinae]|uniref:Uncharacterized protein n=1 Tax=Dermatophagoides farinae TaxID=6954 RepID=A0A922HMZ8_DERFA|nr:hypothetical protein HUG17_6683 [Dermatophagoides farinae]KAH9493748.1 hypothetical protein DERF_014481 [Dermatophagoides farinae]
MLRLYRTLLIIWTIIMINIQSMIVWSMGEEKFLKGLIIGLLFAQNKRQDSSYSSSYHMPVYSSPYHYRYHYR